MKRRNHVINNPIVSVSSAGMDARVRMESLAIYDYVRKSGDVWIVTDTAKGKFKLSEFETPHKSGNAGNIANAAQ